MLAGCGGSQTPIAMPQTNAIATHAQRGTSWMLPEAKSEDLLYASDVHNNVVDVYSFPRGKYVGVLTGFGSPDVREALHWVGHRVHVRICNGLSFYEDREGALGRRLNRLPLVRAATNARSK
jgi:hypothetical protein